MSLLLMPLHTNAIVLPRVANCWERGECLDTHDCSCMDVILHYV